MFGSAPRDRKIFTAGTLHYTNGGIAPLLFGTAGQLGIFITLLLALALEFSKEEAVPVAASGIRSPGKK